jgi:hypothetical protein
MSKGKKKATDSIQPSYKNFSMANQLSQKFPDGSLPDNPRPASKGDTLEYNQGWNYGRTGGQQSPGESEFFKMGRWEGKALYNPPTPEQSSFKNKVAIYLAKKLGGF